MRKIFTFFAVTAFAVIAALCAAAVAGAPRQRDLAAAALPLSIADFAFRYSLDASDEGRVYRVHLANDIFRGLRRPYERDLAVFDSESNPVPFIVRDAEKPYRASDESAPGGPVKLTVPLFSLPPAEKPSALTSAPTMDVTIKTGRDGQVIEIVGGATPGGGTNRFLADLSKAEAPEDGRPILGYGIEIPVAGEEDVAAYVNVYSSGNLRDWRQIARREPLIRLRREDGVIASGVMEVDSSGPVRYLMLEVDGARELPDKIVLSMRLGERRAEIPRDSESFRGRQDDESRSVTYDTAGAFPASEVNFVLEAPGVHRASVSSRNDAESEWRRHGDVLLSFIKNDAGDSRNAPVRVFRTDDRFWRLTLRDRLPSPPPRMQMYWHPKELVFVAQGKPPYILAFGSGRDSPGLAKPDLMQIALGGAGERDILEAGIEASAPPASFDPSPPPSLRGEAAARQWTKYVVWAVLVGGALLLSWIAWNLIRKGKTEG